MQLKDVGMYFKEFSIDHTKGQYFFDVLFLIFVLTSDHIEFDPVGIRLGLIYCQLGQLEVMDIIYGLKATHVLMVWRLILVWYAISKGIACAGMFRFMTDSASVELEDNRAAVSIVQSVTDLIIAWLTTADETFAGAWINVGNWCFILHHHVNQWTNMNLI